MVKIENLLSLQSHDVEANHILEELRKYDVVDFLSKVSALYLLPNNQNKTLVLDTLIATVLEKPETYFSGTAKISNNKFKTIVNTFMDFPIAMNIDPPEMPFIYRIMFYGNHWIFSGIDKDIGYRLQLLLEVLFKNKNDFNEEFINAASRMSHVILSISTKICNDLKYDLNILGHYEKSDMDYPNTQSMKKLQQTLRVDVDFITSVVDDIDAEEIVSVFGERQHNLSKTPDNFKFYYKPFLRIDDKKLLVLNPSELGAFLINYILKKAHVYGEFNNVVKAYNNHIFRECLVSFKKLGHKKIAEESLGIKLLNTDSYKEILLNVANNGVLFVQFFCDSGDKYSFENAHEAIRLNTCRIDKRWGYISKKLKKIPENRIYQICMPGSFSRIIGYRTNRKQSLKHISLSPFDLYCVAVNEYQHSNFIPRYMDCKQNMLEPLTFYGDIYNIAIYSERHSFYLDDNFDYRKDFLYLGFDSAVDYFNKAVIAEDRFLVDFPHNTYLLEMTQTDPERNIYMCNIRETLYILNKFENIAIWQFVNSPSSREELNIYEAITDMCSYWIAECKNIIVRNIYFADSVILEHKLSGDFKNYFSSASYSEKTLEDLIKIRIVDDTITFTWSPEAYFKLAGKDNSQEKAIVTLILEALSCFSDTELPVHKLDKLFENPLKKRVFVLNHQDYPYLKYIDLNFRKISFAYEQQLLDEIGYFLIKEKGMPFGKIKIEERYSVCSSIVDYLYERLQAIISSLNPHNLIELIYLDLEKVMYAMMLTQKRHAFNIACFPEKTRELNTTYSQLNQSSVALKFFMEYVAAQPPKGDVMLGELEYENILTICSAIIHWAQIGDLFKHNIINSEMNILKSGRIGIENTQTNELTESTYAAAIKRLIVHSDPYIDKYNLKNDIINSQELNFAFLAEYGYFYDDFANTIYSLLLLGESISGEIYRKNINELCDIINENIGIEKTKIKKIITDLSLKERVNYLPAPEGYKNTDVWPWRFNRRLSFTRRPLIMIDEDVVWGNRQLFHCSMFTYELIKEGIFKADSKELKKLIGKISDKRGNQFNDAVVEKFKKIESLIVDSKVQKINGKKIAGEDKNTLGDIDVLIINPRKKKIIVGEVKDFSFAKSPYEMQQQYIEVFCDTDKKLCYMSKHKRRVGWIKEHMDDVIDHYHLSKDNWRVDDVLVLSEPIISNEYYHKNQKTILFSDILEKNVFKL